MLRELIRFLIEGGNGITMKIILFSCFCVKMHKSQKIVHSLNVLYPYIEREIVLISSL